MSKKKTCAADAIRALALTALCAAGVVGCRPDDEAAKNDAPPPYVPESYMNDPEFRGKMTEMRQARNKIVNERGAVREKMNAVEAKFAGDASKYKKNPEWKRLDAKRAELDAQYQKARADQLRYARERLSPKTADLPKPPEPPSATKPASK